MARVFVTTGIARTSLAAVRSLGRHGLEVTVGDDGRLPLAGLSRYCHRTVRYPAPARDPEAFVAWLHDHLARERYDVAMPVEQLTYYLFSKHRETLEPLARIPVPELSVFARAYDKAETFRIAERIGIPCPQTYFPTGPSDVEEICRIADFPLVLKPRVGSGSRGVLRVHDAEEFRREWARAHALQPCPLVQEYIPSGGEALGVSALLDRNGKPRAVFAHKRLREYPVSGGPSTLRESVVRPEATALAIRLLQELEWYGVAMVEFKVDPRDGVPKLMEVNAKLWGSISLAIAAGVDFPSLLYELVVNGTVPETSTYQAGVRGRFLLGDLLHFITNPERFRLEPGLFDVRDSRTHGDIWDRDDPVPALAMPLLILWRGWQPDVLRHVLRRTMPRTEASRTSAAPNTVVGGPMTTSRRPIP